MADTIELYECGTKARLVVNPTVEGIITAGLVRFGEIEYEFSYWNGEIITKWMKPGELTFEGGQKETIGYKSGAKQ